MRPAAGWLLLALAVAGCKSDGDRRTFGAACAADDECGCFEPGVGDDPGCDDGATEMACVELRCTLACEFGDRGDATCRAWFRPSTHCTFEGTCAE